MFSSSVQLSHHQLYAYSSSCNERFNLRYSVAIKVASKFLLLRFAIKIYVEGAVSRSNLDSMVNFFSFFLLSFSFFPQNSGHRRKHEDNIIFIADTSQGRVQSLESCARQNRAHESRTPLRGPGPLFQMGN